MLTKSTKFHCNPWNTEQVILSTNFLHRSTNKPTIPWLWYTHLIFSLHEGTSFTQKHHPSMNLTVPEYEFISPFRIYVIYIWEHAAYVISIPVMSVLQ